MFRTRSMLALSAALLAAGAASHDACADGSDVGRDTPPKSISAVRKDSREENVQPLFAQPLAAKLASAGTGAAVGGTSSYLLTFSPGGPFDVALDNDMGL